MGVWHCPIPRAGPPPPRHLDGPNTRVQTAHVAGRWIAGVRPNGATQPSADEILGNAGLHEGAADLHAPHAHFPRGDAGFPAAQADSFPAPTNEVSPST